MDTLNDCFVPSIMDILYDCLAPFTGNTLTLNDCFVPSIMDTLYDCLEPSTMEIPNDCIAPSTRARAGLRELEALGEVNLVAPNEIEKLKINTKKYNYALY